MNTTNQMRDDLAGARESITSGELFTGVELYVQMVLADAPRPLYPFKVDLAEVRRLKAEVDVMRRERDELAARLAEIERAEPVQGPAWLTDEQISDLIAQTWGSVDIAPQSAAAFARAVEAWMLGHCEDARGMVPERAESAANELPEE